MKIILIAAVLALLPVSAYAICRIGGATPILRSVLDNKQQPSSPLHFGIAPAAYQLTIVDYAPGRPPGGPQDANTQDYYQRKRATASRLTVAGCFLTVGGSALLLSSANGNSSQASVTNTLFAVALVTGIGLLIGGITMSSRYGRHKKPQ